MLIIIKCGFHSVSFFKRPNIDLHCLIKRKNNTEQNEGKGSEKNKLELYVDLLENSHLEAVGDSRKSYL